MKLLQITLVGAFSVLLTVTSASAQLSTAQLSGRVIDQSGAVLPGVTVTVNQTDTGLTRSVTTGTDGAYVVPNLPTGPYRLEATLQGFRTYVQTGIVLQVGAAPVINLALAVGGVNETVSVDAAAPLVDVRSAGISEVVDNRRIVELPLQGRQVTDLLVLAGAAVQTATVGSRIMNGGVRISVAGGLPNGVSYLLDGASHNNPQSNSNLPLPFPDALDEFRVATSGLSAQNGMHGAAAVNAVTKSGTNTFHGGGFEFLRDRRLNATSPFAAIGPDGKRKDDGLRRNQFGGTFGGPIARDRLFFFGAYQGTAVRVRPADRIGWVPTAQMLAGDFTALAAPACTGGRQINLGGGFVGNRISPAAFSPAALNLARRLPATTDPCGLITFTTSEDTNERQPLGRIDYHWGNVHSVFGRYMATTFKRDPAYQGGSDNVLKTVSGGLDNVAQSLTLGHTMVLGSSMVNSLRVAYNKTKVHRSNSPYFDPETLGIKLHPYVPNQMVVAVTSGFTIAGKGQTQASFLNNFYQVADDFTLVHGQHQFGVGANVAYTHGHYVSATDSSGVWEFDGSASGLGLADFMLGRPSLIEHAAPSVLPVHNYYVGLYGQDAWRATNRLTFNLGLRWEPYFGHTLENDESSIFSLDNFQRGIKSSVFVNAPPGLLYSGDPGFPAGKTGLNKQWWNFSPRLGMAWDITGDGRMALRASYALAYDFMPAEYHSVSSDSPPFGNLSAIEDPPGRMDDPYASMGGDPHPIVTNRNSPFVQFGAFGTMDPSINSPRVQNWNVTFERQLGIAYSVAASYLGSYSDRLWSSTALNPGVFMGLGPCTIANVSYTVCTTNANLDVRRVLYPQNPKEAQFLGSIDETVALGFQTYHGLKLSAQRRSAKGVSLNGSYTLSRCIGTDTPDTFNQPSAGYVKPGDPSYDKGYCDQDRRHLATLTGGYQTPNLGGGLGVLASGWRVTGIVNARTGNRVNVIAGSDVAGTGMANQRPNQVSNDLYASPRTLTNYFNRAAFARPTPGTYGNLPRNALVGPNYWSADMGISREIHVVGTQTFELRLETFNLFNTFHWGDPSVVDPAGGANANFNSGTFGRITTLASPMRIIQFGVKYLF
jgi:hypothetical protein